MCHWVSEGRSVTLRFDATEKCSFHREETKFADSNTQTVVESSVLGTFTSKTVTKVVEHSGLSRCTVSCRFIPELITPIRLSSLKRLDTLN